MLLEIERKFLVKNSNYKKECYKKYSIKQGFLNSNKNRVVRIRMIDKKGLITVKGISSKDGTSRFEWEKEISIKEATSLLMLCEETIIEKNRYLVSSGEHIIEVDEFLNHNQGLIIAEIELNSVDENYFKPKWLGIEVTGITKYYNSELSKNPFQNWE